MTRRRTDPQAELDAFLRSDFLAFLHKVFLTLTPGETFKDNWHLAAIAHQLQRVSAGETSRLIIMMPPRSLKSITTSVAWVAWELGHDPSKTFVCCSYSAELATKHARDCRFIMQSSWYRRIFPGTILSKERNAEHDFQTTARGGRFSTSVGGTLTGRGGDVLIIDDPTKPEDAASEVARKATFEWFGGTALSRLNDKATGSIIGVMQRLHEDDLAGRLLEAGGWDHLNLPAIAEIDELIPIGGGQVVGRRVGDLLHEDREGLEVLMGLKALMGSAAFSAQYQQAPLPAAGLMVQRAWLTPRYRQPPEKATGDRIVQSWDCASKEGIQNDYSVCITALVRKRMVYVLDVFRERLGAPELNARARELARRWRADALLIEDAAGGTQLLQWLGHDQPDGIPLPIACQAEGPKEVRLYGACPHIEAGGLTLPEEAPWLADFEKELLGFPNARHDDQVDALTQLLNWVTEESDYDISDIVIDLETFHRRNPFRIGD